MSEHTSNEQGSEVERRRGLGRRMRLGIGALALVLTGALLGVIGTVATGASAHGWRAHHGHGWHHKGAATVEDAKARVERFAGFALDEVDATPEQREQVNDIMQGLVEKLYPLREQHRTNRSAFIEALAAETVDRDALDALREAELGLAETASEELVETIAQLSEILDATQRAELTQFMRRSHD